MAVVLGLLVALFYGSGDFFGGLAAKESRASAVVIGSVTVSAACLTVITAGWAVAGGLPSPAHGDLLIGVATGLIGPISLEVAVPVLVTLPALTSAGVTV